MLSSRPHVLGLAFLLVGPFGSLVHAQSPAPGTGSTVLGEASPAYRHHFAPMSGPPALGFSGPALFGALLPGGSGSTGFGDAVRVCYGIDTTQGGANQSTGQTAIPWFRQHQGFGPRSGQAGVQLGLVSIAAATDSDAGGDACFAPFHASTASTGGFALGVASTGGRLPSTAPASWPVAWEINYSWGPSAITVPNVLGNDAGDSGIPALGIPPRGLGNPLLANVVLEIQGPLNGPTTGDEQYYLASTTEWLGLSSSSGPSGPQGAGGVANGLSTRGSSLFPGNPTAETTGLVAHSRLFARGPGGAAAGPPPELRTPILGGVARPGRVELALQLAFETPFLWAEHRIPGAAHPTGGRWIVGGGGPDWRVSQAPLSEVDLVLVDHRSGALANGDRYSKVASTYTFTTPGGASGQTLGTGLPAAGYAGSLGGAQPCVVPQLNRAFFLWSATANERMLQAPGSWDTAGGLGVAAGSQLFGDLPTARRGGQRLPLRADALTFAMLGRRSLTYGSPFSGSDDFFQDGPLDLGGQSPVFFSSLFEGGFLPRTSGRSELIRGSGGLQVSRPDPALAGARLFAAAFSTHLDLCQWGGRYSIDEVANALTISLQ